MPDGGGGVEAIIASLAAGVAVLLWAAALGQAAPFLAHGRLRLLMTSASRPVGGRILKTAVEMARRMASGYVRRTATMRVEGSLPEIIDLMIVCADAGLSLPMSLRYVADTARGPLGDELRRTLSAVAGGTGLSDALRDLGTKWPSPSLGFFARTLAQSYERGNPISDVLKAQAWMVRQQKKQALDALVRAMPVKIAVCSILFFMPAILAVTVLPAVLLFLQSGW